MMDVFAATGGSPAGGAAETAKKKGKAAVESYTKNSYGARQAESKRPTVKQNTYKPDSD
jgi:hypothetical protein